MKHYILLIPLFFAGYHPPVVSASLPTLQKLRSTLQQLEQREREMINYLRREKREVKQMIRKAEQLQRANALLKKTTRNLNQFSNNQ